MTNLYQKEICNRLSINAWEKLAQGICGRYDTLLGPEGTKAFVSEPGERQRSMLPAFMPVIVSFLVSTSVCKVIASRDGTQQHT